MYIIYTVYIRLMDVDGYVKSLQYDSIVQFHGMLPAKSQLPGMHHSTHGRKRD